MSREDSGIAETGRDPDLAVPAIDAAAPDIRTDMNAHGSLLLAASLGLAACADTSIRTSAHGLAVSDTRLTVHVVEADGGG